MLLLVLLSFIFNKINNLKKTSPTNELNIKEMLKTEIIIEACNIVIPLKSSFNFLLKLKKAAIIRILINEFKKHKNNN